MVFYHKGLRVRKTPLPFVACARKAAILHVQIWSEHESDVVGVDHRSSPSYLVLLEHALGFAIEEGGDPGIDTRTTRRCDYGQPPTQILVDPNGQLANPGFLGLCPFFGTPGEVVFYRVLEFLTQFLWRAAIEINNILDANDTSMEGIGRWIKRNMRV